MKQVCLSFWLTGLLLLSTGITTVQAVQQENTMSDRTKDSISSSFAEMESTRVSSDLTETSSSSLISEGSSSETRTSAPSEEAATSEVVERLEPSTSTKGTVHSDYDGLPYATVVVKEGVLYDAAEHVIRTDLTALYQQTYKVQTTGEIDDQTVYGLWSNQGTFIGYLPEGAITFSEQPLGAALATEQFGHLSANSVLYQDLALSQQVDVSAYQEKTLHAVTWYHHFDGTSYLAVSNQKQQIIGYVQENQFLHAKGPQGNYQPVGRYITITQDDLILFQNFNWTKKSTTKTLLGKTYLAKGKYTHFNGTIYLSLYDSKNTWIGYLPQSGTKQVDAPQGNYQTYQKYVTITSKNYDLWQNFSWKSKNKSKILIGQTLYAKGRYQHFNGSTFLSLYDNHDRWLGYLNQSAVSVAPGKQGSYQSYGQTITITKNYDLWQNFAWQKKESGQHYYNQLLTARGKYQHFNGSTYLSLYTAKGKWIGYINQNGVKHANSQKEKLKKVQNLLNASTNDKMSVYVMSLVDGETASRNSTMNVHPASTGKLPALYYTQKMILEKKLDANKKYTYTDAINRMPYSYMRGGAGILQGKKFGQQFSLKQIQTMTAKYSDNQGANFLGYYGTNQYDSKMKNEISRIIGRTWTGPFKINAKENALLMQAIYNQGGQLINDLSNTVYDNQRIPKYLPVKVAHKIGDLTSVAHDIAIVYTDQPYVLSIMTRNTSYETISKLSKQIYELMK